jgi:glutathione S-transferase
MEVILDTIEGLIVPKGYYLLGKRPVVADYYVLALILLLNEIFGEVFKKTSETKIVLRKWINLITHRPNIMKYLQRQRTVPLIDWKWN